MKSSPYFSISEAKQAIRPTLYWARRRLVRQLYFLKQDLIQELNKSCLTKWMKIFI